MKLGLGGVEVCVGDEFLRIGGERVAQTADDVATVLASNGGDGYAGLIIEHRRQLVPAMRLPPTPAGPNCDEGGKGNTSDKRVIITSRFGLRFLAELGFQTASEVLVYVCEWFGVAIEAGQLCGIFSVNVFEGLSEPVVK